MCMSLGTRATCLHEVCSRNTKVEKVVPVPQVQVQEVVKQVIVPQIQEVIEEVPVPQVRNFMRCKAQQKLVEVRDLVAFYYNMSVWPQYVITKGPRGKLSYCQEFQSSQPNSKLVCFGTSGDQAHSA